MFDLKEVKYFNSFMTEAVIVSKPVQWTGFYMITPSVMKELKKQQISRFKEVKR